MKRIKVLSIFGTRPEAIKMCPLIKELESIKAIESIVCVTGQHREMLDQVLDIFQIKPDFDLNLMKERQTLTTITTTVLSTLEPLLKSEKPDIVLVHGDTTTSATAALAAFYQKIPVGHVEAGLRTYDNYSPFPEEMNRKIISQIAELFFAPTITNKENLEKENIFNNVFVTGNTVIDSFKYTVKDNYLFKNEHLQTFNLEKSKLVLVTAHRRENLGQPLENICNAIKKLVANNPEIEVVYPVHLNPAVREIVFKILGGLNRIHLIDPIDVEDMHNIMSRSFLIMTDSGGLQEEGPSFGVPVIVLRTETERPEAIEAGTAVLGNVKEGQIYALANELINNPFAYESMAKAINPYGDGAASSRIAKHIIEWYRKNNCML